MRLALLVAVLAAACVRSESVRCADGTVCPSGTQCDLANATCVVPSQIEACNGLADGDACAAEGLPAGECRAGSCISNACGDGMRTGAEQCDPSDPAANASTCTGDGGLGYHEGGAVACTESCTWDIATAGCALFCGDGELNGPELCERDVPFTQSCIDYGFDYGRLGCGNCTPELSLCGQIGWRARPLGAFTNFSDPISVGDAVYVGAVENQLTTARQVVLRFANDSWQTVGDFPSEDGLPRIVAVYATAANAIWVGAEVSRTPSDARQGVIYFFDGTAWTEVFQLPPGLAVRSLVVDGSDFYYTAASISNPAMAPAGIYRNSTLLGAGNYQRLVGGTDRWAIASVDNSLARVTNTAVVPVALPTGMQARALATLGDGRVAVLATLGTNANVLVGNGTWSAPVFVDGAIELGIEMHLAVGSGDTDMFISYMKDNGNTEHRIMHVDGRVARELARDLDPNSVDDGDILAVAGGEVVVVNNRLEVSYHYAGSAWSPTTQTTPYGKIWGTAFDDLYASRRGSSGPQNLISHFDGTRWTQSAIRGEVDGADGVGYSLDGQMLYALPDGDAHELDDLALHFAVRGRDDIYLATGDEVVHWNGTSVTPVFAISGITDLDCPDVPSTCFAIAGTGGAYALTGTTATPLAPPPVMAPDVVWAGPDGAVFVGGNAGAIAWQVEPGAWQTAQLALSEHVVAIHGTTNRDVIALTSTEAGTTHSLFRFDGTSWARIRSGVPASVTRVVAVWNGGTTIVVGGEHGSAFRFLHRTTPWQ